MVFAALISTTFAQTDPFPGLDFSDRSYIISIDGRNIRVPIDAAQRVIERSIRFVRGFNGQDVVNAVENLRGYARWIGSFYTGATAEIRAELARYLNEVLDFDELLFGHPDAFVSLPVLNRNPSGDQTRRCVLAEEQCDRRSGSALDRSRRCHGCAVRCRQDLSTASTTSHVHNNFYEAWRCTERAFDGILRS